MSKPKTQEQLDRETDKRLLKKYGVGLDWYDRKLEEQGDGCLLCGSTEKTRRLHVDHDHHWVDAKIKYTRNRITGWDAEATYRGVLYLNHGFTKSEAGRAIKGNLKKDSVRGLLCFRCNKFIVGFGGPKILRKAADYLEAHQGEQQ